MNRYHSMFSTLTMGLLLAAAPAGTRAEASAARGADSAWLERVTAVIAAQEYEFSLHEGNWSAPNRAQGLRARIDERGFGIVPREPGDDPFELRLELRRVQRGGGSDAEALALRPGVVRATATRATVDRGAVREWLENAPGGIEHGFTIDAPPDGASGALRVVLALAGTLRAYRLDADTIAMRDAQGRERVRYASLHVDDARGEALPASLEVVRGAIEIVVDDRGAVYPLRIDPLATSAAWTVYGGQAGAHFGTEATTAGDVNGDGLSDVLVSAPDFDTTVGSAGRVYLYLGSPSGLSTPAAWRATGTQGGEALGSAIAAAGDVNGDGYGDVIITGGKQGDGAAFAYYGSASGLPASPSWIRYPVNGYAANFTKVSGVGDFNGDGYDDIVLGQPEHYRIDPDTGLHINRGALSLLMGGPNGLPPGTVVGQDDAGPDYTRLGEAVTALGDVDADGYDDFAGGNPEIRQVIIYYGNAAGDFAHRQAQTSTSAAARYYGASVAGIGDWNGDGYADMVGGDKNATDTVYQQGMIELHLGSAAGITSAPAAVVFGTQYQGQYGYTVGSAGDVNGDGYADFLAGSPFYPVGGPLKGRIDLFQGRPGAVPNPLLPTQTISSTVSPGILGGAAETAGDVNGDGYSDVLIGDTAAKQTLDDEGRVQLYLGGPNGLSTSVSQQLNSQQANSRFGMALAAAGDVNGDAYSDLIVGAPYYDYSGNDSGCAYVFHGSATGFPAIANWRACGDRASVFLGRSVAGIGDVNNDGYGDVAVGAPDWDDVATNDGRVFAWLGSNTGLGVDGTPANADWIARGDAAGARLGEALGALDANGDGFSDLLAGGQGKAWLFAGSSSGLAASAAWTRARGSSFGLTLTGAGDVNGDGYEDALVGEKQYTNDQPNEGAAHLYLGSASGLLSSEARTWEPNQANAFLGSAVAAAGDVDGDGFDDILIGIDQYDAAAGANAGRVELYFGTVSGPGPLPSWSLNGTSAGLRYGYALAAGDFNNDGYSDIAVGTPYAIFFGFTECGEIDEYLGSPSGPSTTADWIQFGTSTFARLGARLASNLDINGDGFADLVASRQVLPDLDTDGGLYTFYGGGGDGLDRFVQQRYLLAPISVTGMNGSSDSLDVRARVRSAAGRTKVRLDLEVKPAGTPFNGQVTSLASSTTQRTPAPGATGTYVDRTVTKTDLARDIQHWRARAASTDPRFPHGPWMSPAANARTHFDVRMQGAVLPGKVVGVRVQREFDLYHVTWTTLSNAASYDAVRGPLSVLRNTAGDYSQATASCVADNVPGTGFFDPSIPTTGDGLWYLVRASNAIGAGSYDDTSPRQLGLRDAEITASGHACP